MQKFNFYFIVDLQCCVSFGFIAKWSLLRFFSYLGHYRVLNRVPCAMQYNPLVLNRCQKTTILAALPHVVLF